MRKLLFLLALLPSVAQAQWIKGFNARDTAAYCTDPANTTYLCVTSGVGCNDAYPTTRNGVTFGATANIGDNKRDRSAAIDCRLAGASFRANNAASSSYIRVDLPAAGDYDFRLAMGQGGGFTAGANQRTRLCEDSSCSTVLATITDASVAADHWVDATGVERTSAADWTANNVALRVTFAGTTAYVAYGYGDGSTSGNTFLSHFQLEQISTAAAQASRLNAKINSHLNGGLN